MKTQKTMVIPARPAEPERTGTIYELVCDFCKEEIEAPDDRDYEFNFARVEHKLGNHWGDQEGGSYIREWIDICPDCFANRLMPWVISQGIQFQGENQSY